MPQRIVPAAVAKTLNHCTAIDPRAISGVSPRVPAACRTSPAVLASMKSPIFPAKPLSLGWRTMLDHDFAALPND